MVFIRNLLAIIGLLFLLVGGAAAYKAYQVKSEFDPDAVKVYMEFADRLLETKDPGIAMVYSVPVEEGLSYEDVKKSLISLSKQKNVLYAGERPFYKRLEARSGKPHRVISFLAFCHPKSGEMVTDYEDAYTSFMPTRIAIVEDKSGKLWLHTMKLDLMIYGGKPLPPELKLEAQHVWKTTKDMVDEAAEGSF